MRRRIWRLTLAAVAIGATAIGLGLAAPAYAAAPVDTATASAPVASSAPADIYITPGGQVIAAPAAATSAHGSASPDYAAGTYFYVCVNTDGSTLTLEYQQPTTTCDGAAAIQQWLESGQYVQTLQLTSAGSQASATFTGTADCYVALAAGVIAVLTIEDSWAWYTSAALSGFSLHACISG